MVVATTAQILFYVGSSNENRSYSVGPMDTHAFLLFAFLGTSRVAGKTDVENQRRGRRDSTQSFGCTWVWRKESRQMSVKGETK